MKTVSVIIPLYNAENFISQAVNSIICQKGVEIEVIVVNDGSTDHSLEVLSVFGKRIKIISIKNSGASVARNVGLRYATGDYVMFLDADDYIADDNICKQAIDTIDKTKSEMCMFLYTYYNNSTKSFVHLKKFPQSLLERTDCSDVFSQLIKEGIAPVSPCCKVIKRNHLFNNELFFMEGTVAEDLEWLIRLIIRTQTVCLINNDSYIYRKNLSSSVTGGNSIIKCINHHSMISLSLERLKGTDDKKKIALFSLLSYQYCIWLSQIWSFKNDKSLIEKAKSMSWLLEYDLYPGVKYVRRIHGILGVHTIDLLHLFYVFMSKSNR